MKEALHLRFDNSSVGHQKITVFMDGGNCGTLTLRPEEATWFHHICSRGSYELELSFLSSGNPVRPNPSLVDKFALDHKGAL